MKNSTRSFVVSKHPVYLLTTIPVPDVDEIFLGPTVLAYAMETAHSANYFQLDFFLSKIVNL